MRDEENIVRKPIILEMVPILSNSSHFIACK